MGRSICLLALSCGTPLSHPHCPLGQLSALAWRGPSTSGRFGFQGCRGQGGAWCCCPPRAARRAKQPPGETTTAPPRSPPPTRRHKDGSTLGRTSGPGHTQHGLLGIWTVREVAKSRADESASSLRASPCLGRLQAVSRCAAAVNRGGISRWSHTAAPAWSCFNGASSRSPRQPAVSAAHSSRPLWPWHRSVA